MTPVVLSQEELALIKTLSPAELAEAIRRLKAKSAAYLRSAQLIEAWEGKGRWPLELTKGKSPS